MALKPKSKILLGMTGGLSSVVAACLLKNQGFEVVAICLQLIDDKWSSLPTSSLSGKKLSASRGPSCQIIDLEQVKSICDKLQVPFYAVDVRTEFRSRVINQVMAARLHGHFFATCMECNNIKFRILAQKAKKLQCQYIATGHCARIHGEQGGDSLAIYRSRDQQNDQSHLLAQVAPTDFKNVIFPLDGLSKKEIMEIAENYHLEYLDQPGECERHFFYGQQILTYIEQMTDSSLRKSVNLFDQPQGVDLGPSQRGLYHFYLGQPGYTCVEQGQNIDRDLVVTKLCPETQVVTLGERAELGKRQMKVGKLNFSQEVNVSRPCQLYIKLATEGLHPAIVWFKNNNTAIVEFEQSIYGQSPGHGVVFYSNSTSSARLLGAGVVEQFANFAPIVRGCPSPGQALQPPGGEAQGRGEGSKKAFAAFPLDF